MRGNDLRNKIDNGRAALEFCGVGIRLRDIALEAVFAPQPDFLLNAKATLTNAKPVNIPRFENKGRIGQHPGRSDLVDSSIEVERCRRHRRIEALGNGYHAFHRRAGQRLIGCRRWRQPQHCCGYPNGSEPEESDRADHGVA